MGMVVVGEGVEREDQLRYLERVGCNQSQGYHLGKPMTADAFVDFLARHA